MSLTQGDRLGRYEVVALIGAGGMGEVYRARDTNLQRDVALKILPDLFAADPERLARFRREAQVLASLNHPNIATIFGLEEAHGVLALAMELVEGPTLAERIEGYRLWAVGSRPDAAGGLKPNQARSPQPKAQSRAADGPLPLHEVLHIARQIADALEAAHEKNVVHRDLKPANIKLRPDGAVKVLDFGLAKALDPLGAPDASEHLPTVTDAATRRGTILGTAAYMSPEQTRGAPLDKRTDIWAFGCVLYEMLAGVTAFAGDTLADTIGKVLERQPDWHSLPETTPSSVRRLLERCLEKDPKRRLRDIGDARIELEDAHATTAPLMPRARDARTPRRWIGVAAGLIAVSLVSIVLTVLTLQRPPANLRPVRLSVVAPHGTTFTQRDITEHPQFALSPDGSRLAFVASAPGGRPQLWVRSLESGGAQPLAGSEGASGPFWSPDGQNLGFMARGKLKRISLGGAAAQDVADLTADVTSGTWSPQGVIVFSSGAGGTLFQVPAEGGRVTSATTLDVDRNETSHTWPQFLPDGRRFIFYVRSSTPENAGVYLGSMDGGSNTQILRSTASALYAEPGYLLFEQNGTLTRQSFDPRSGALSGRPETLGDRILGLRGPGYLPVSAARDGTVAYWNGPLTPTNLLWFDRGGRAIGQVGSTVRYESPVLANDATKLLVTIREDANTNSIWRIDLSTGASSRFTFTPGVAHFGIWSPDGQSVAYSTLDKLFEKPASGAGQEAPIPGPGRYRAIFPDDWSRDGRWLFYVVAARTAMDVGVLNLDNHKAAPILETPANEVQPRLSPNGRWLAYASDESGAFEIYVQGFGEARGKWQVSTAGGSQPIWRGDGRELFYMAPDGRLNAVAIRGDRTFEAGPPHPLFQTTLPAVLAPNRTGYAVSPDGQRFLLNSLRPNPDPSAITIVLNGTAALKK